MVKVGLQQLGVLLFALVTVFQNPAEAIVFVPGPCHFMLPSSSFCTSHGIRRDRLQQALDSRCGEEAR